jgi:hypothetical protein
MTSLPNFIKIYQLCSKVIGGGGGTQTDRQTDRETGDLISLTFLFKESRLKMTYDFVLVQSMSLQQKLLKCFEHLESITVGKR